MKGWAGVILAAGLGTRMKSTLPKVLHKVCGQELIIYPVETLRKAGVHRIVVVVSPRDADVVRNLLGDAVEYVVQSQPLGTGHAMLQASAALNGQVENVIVTGSDSPLILPASLKALTSNHTSTRSHMTVLSAHSSTQDDMGTIERDIAGSITGILEASERQHIDHEVYEINSGTYCFKNDWLWEHLPTIKKSKVGEFYITSLAKMATPQGSTVQALIVDDSVELLGVNDRRQLAQAQKIMSQRIRDRWMLEGITMLDPDSVFLDTSVELGIDTIIYPNTMILGRSKVGVGCTIGPGTMVRDSVIGTNCTVTASFIEESTLEDSVDVGPFSHLRPGAYLESGVHIGNFSEIKDSRLAHGVAMGHFGYVGDASIGANTNIGAGTVTCNYDGQTKHKTVVGDAVLIGSDTMLVAPVKVGTGAITGAGAVVTKDVPPYRLAVGVPATIKKSRKASPAIDQ